MLLRQWLQQADAVNWVTDAASLVSNTAMLLRLPQQAAEQGAASLVLLRRPATGLSLPVNLSLTLTAHPQGVLLSVHKRKGGWPARPFLVDMQSRWPALSYRYDGLKQAQRKAG